MILLFCLILAVLCLLIATALMIAARRRCGPPLAIARIGRCACGRRPGCCPYQALFSEFQRQQPWEGRN